MKASERGAQQESKPMPFDHTETSQEPETQEKPDHKRIIAILDFSTLEGVACSQVATIIGEALKMLEYPIVEVTCRDEEGP